MPDSMNDEETAKQKKRVQDFYEEWGPNIGLGWWTVTYEWHRDQIPSARTCEGRSAIADCRVDWQYRRATIRWDLDLVKDMSDDELEKTVIHEMMHVFLNETRGDPSDWLDHEERVAETLAQAFLWTKRAYKSKDKPEDA